jgi:prolyl-tRNA synthetase
MSERLLGAIVGIHGDDKGIILPPKIAPVQFVIIPILAKGKAEFVTENAIALRNELGALGHRAFVDLRDQRPGSKHYDWEIKGAPIRVEIGPRDIENGTLVFARRDLSTKRTVKRSDLAVECRTALEEVGSELLSRARRIIEKGIRTVDTIEDFRRFQAEGWDGVVRTHWCGEMGCAEQMEKDMDKVFLGYPLADIATGALEQSKGGCLNCGKPTSTVVLLAKNY